MNSSQQPPSDQRTAYWRRAEQLIKVGLITRKEALDTARVGTRKEGYWARHLLDLEAFASTMSKVRGIPVPPDVEPAKPAPPREPTIKERSEALGIKSMGALHLYTLLSRRPYKMAEIKKALGNVAQSSLDELTRLNLAEYSYKNEEAKLCQTSQ